MSTDQRLGFEIGFTPSARRATPREPDAPFRLLICADLCGSARAPLAAREPLRTDIDNLEAVVRRIGSRLVLPAALGGSTLAVESLDDLHPDRLLQAVPAFAQLRALRGELQDPQRWQRAAAALQGGDAAAVAQGGASNPAEPSAAPAGNPPSAAADAAADDVERLLGRRPAAPPAAASVTASALQRWLHDLVAPHVRPDDGGQRLRLVESVDAAIAATMRTLLREPSLRRLEAAWRGIARLVAELGGEDTVELWLLDAGHDELVADVRGAAADLRQSALARVLGVHRDDAETERPWSMAVVDRAFGPTQDDVTVLAALGSLSAAAGAALLADADPAWVGCEAVRDLADPGTWAAPDDARRATWAALRSLDCADSVGLALPRVLQRLPYGARTDPVAGFAFEEVVDPADPDAYLWGGASLALALLAGRAFAGAGWSMQLDAQREVDDLPAYSWRDADGAARLRPCAEVLLGERAAERLLGAGLMPVLARRDRASVQLLRWQSIADPPSALHGAWVG